MMKAPAQAKILKDFALPKSRTKFVPDDHYMTDPDDLDNLFT